jgi:hypothetical protein
MLRRGWLLPGLSWLAASATATAQPARSLDVRVRCSGLATEQRAAIEARARTDLLSRGHAVGLLELTCGPGEAQAQWLPAPGAPPATSSIPLPNEAQVEERLLELVARVLEVDAGAAAQGSTAVATFSDADASPPRPSPASTSAPPAPGPTERRPAPSLRHPQWSSSAGGYLEPWFGAAVLAGPRAGLGVLVDRYWLGVTGAFGAALSHRGAIAPIVAEPTVEVAIRPVAELVLATGAGASWLRLTSSTALAPSSAARWRATAFARAGLLFPTGPSSGLAFAASLQCFDRALEVHADGKSQWSAPACAPRFVVSYESRLPTPYSARPTR